MILSDPLNMRVLHHDWFSEHWRDVTDRIELVKELIKLPPDIAGAIIAKLEHDQAERARKLIRGFLQIGEKP